VCNNKLLQVVGGEWFVKGVCNFLCLGGYPVIFRWGEGGILFVLVMFCVS
jgi:hypothetical protein